jgi:hypothetical protein
MRDVRDKEIVFDRYVDIALLITIVFNAYWHCLCLEGAIRPSGKVFPIIGCNEAPVNNAIIVVFNLKETLIKDGFLTAGRV